MTNRWLLLNFEALGALSVLITSLFAIFNTSKRRWASWRVHHQCDGLLQCPVCLHIHSFRSFPLRVDDFFSPISLLGLPFLDRYEFSGVLLHVLAH